MIATLAIVLTFVVLGLAVVLVALRNGPKRPAAARSRRRGGLAPQVLGLAAVGLVCLVGIPGLVLANNASDQSKAAPGGLELTASQQKGRELFAERCGNCHTLGASNSVGKVGPSLDAIIPALPDDATRRAFTLDAIKNGRARGMGQMPAEAVDGQDAEDVADFVSRAAGR